MLALTVLDFHRLRVDPPLTLPAGATVGVPDTGRATTELLVTIVALGFATTALARLTSQRSTVASRSVMAGGAMAAVAVALWSTLVALVPAAATSGAPRSSERNSSGMPKANSPSSSGAVCSSPYHAG